MERWAIRLRTAWVPFLAVLATGIAGAEEPGTGDEDRLNRSAFYVGGGGVFASDVFEGHIEEVVEDAFGVPVSVEVEETWGANARLGYRFGSWLALEAHYEWIDEFDIDISSLGVPLGGASLEAHTLTLNGKLIAPVWRTQPYLLVGAGGSIFEFRDRTPLNLLGGDGEKAGFAGRAGGGVDLHLTDHLVLNAEASVVLTTQDFRAPGVGDLDDLYYVSASVGLRVRF